MNRTLSKEHIEYLCELIEIIKNDHTLFLGLRSGYISIYYRGGCILKVSISSNGYKAIFDNDYDKKGDQIILKDDNVNDWIEKLPVLKGKMDKYFSEKNKNEREIQQHIARENNRSVVSNDSEYFIADIEYATEKAKIKNKNARFDMLGVQWLASKRKDGTSCIPTFIEVKYGDGAIDGNAGIFEHLEDLEGFLSVDENKEEVFKDIEEMFEQMRDLELIDFSKSGNKNKVTINKNAKPQVIILLANTNPRGTKLKNEIEKLKDYKNFDLKFAQSSLMGYGLYSNCMLSLEQLKELY